MQSIVAHVRKLLGWTHETPPIRTSFKRDRNDDDFSSDDDTPDLKKLRRLNNTNFPDIMADTNLWEKEKPAKHVRYVPIQVESGYPSTSTPLDTRGSIEKMGSRARTVPIQLVSIKENVPSTTPARKPRIHTPVRPVIHVEEDEDDEVTWVEARSQPKQKSKVYINLEDKNQREHDDDDVVFVKKISPPATLKPYQFIIANDGNDETDFREEPVYYKLKKVSDRNSMSPRSQKFISHPGISKSYKKPPTPISKWLQGTKSTNLIRNKYLGLNNNTRTTLSEVFNLDEKKNYQELIKRVAASAKPAAFSRPLDIITLADDSASFRNTLRTQKKSLDEIKLLEKELLAERDSIENKEYDPITVASINSSDSEVEIVPSESSSSSVRICPINTLKDSYKDKAITTKNWLTDLDTKYKKKKAETQEKLKDARRESDIIAKVNSEQKIAHLEYKLKYDLSIPESLFEEPQPTVELPALTPEQEKVVNRALGPGPPGQLLIEKFNLRIHRRDLQTLAGLNWLNDEVINFYMNLLMQRSEERKDLPKVYAANTFFYPKLMQSGQAGLRRWTRKVDIFAHDLMVVPVHLGVHWCLALIEFTNKRVKYLDSMGGRNQACLDALMQYLRDEHKDKKGEPFQEKGWTAECLKDIPQQMNGSDCGMFSCTFAEFSSRNAPYTFTQSHMPYLRRKMALEILQGKLLL